MRRQRQRRRLILENQSREIANEIDNRSTGYEREQWEIGQSCNRAGEIFFYPERHKMENLGARDGQRRKEDIGGLVI